MTELLYFEPTSISEALSLMRQYGNEILPIAGGTDLVLDVHHRRKQKSHILSLTCIEELSYIQDHPTLSIGPTTTLTELSQSTLLADRCQMLVEGAGVVGSVQIRNLASIGGNLCNALPCADTVPPLAASDAQIVIAQESRLRTMPITAFIRGPRWTDLGPDELVIEIRLPKKPLTTGSTYLKHTYRKALDMTIVGMAISVTLDATGERIVDAAIALGNAGPAPTRATEAETLLTGILAEDDSVLDAFANAVVNSSSVRDSAVRASAQYRKRVLGILAKRGLKTAIERARSKIAAQGT